MSTRALTVGVFIALGCSLIVLELVARLPRSRIPTVSRLLAGGLHRRSVRVIVVLSWWWAGWHFLADGGD